MIIVCLLLIIGKSIIEVVIDILILKSEWNMLWGAGFSKVRAGGESFTSSALEWMLMCVR